MSGRRPIRKSVPTDGVSRWWLCGWLYVMPDFDRADHSILEWISTSEPVEPDNDPHADALARQVADLEAELAGDQG